MYVYVCIYMYIYILLWLERRGRGSACRGHGARHTHMITHSCLHTHMTRQRVSWPWCLSRHRHRHHFSRSINTCSDLPPCPWMMARIHLWLRSASLHWFAHFRSANLYCCAHITIIYVVQSYHYPTGVVFRLWSSGFTIQRLVFWASGDWHSDEWACGVREQCVWGSGAERESVVYWYWI
jgi:hypothetical protein